MLHLVTAPIEDERHVLSPNLLNFSSLVSGFKLQTMTLYPSFRFTCEGLSGQVSKYMSYAMWSYTFKIKLADKQFTHHDIL